MKIIFICSSLEPGKDGVGDYTRLLAAELIRQGHLTAIIALHDKFVKDNAAISGEQPQGKISVPVLRLSSEAVWKNKTALANEYINTWNPDVISLQYVPYGFHKKGLPFQLARYLPSLGRNRKWHIMFHELWQGEGKASSFKEKLIGFVQKRIVSQLMNGLQAKQSFTNSLFFRTCLLNEKIESRLAPVFSNLASSTIANDVLLKKLPFPIQQSRSEYIVSCFFGSVRHHSELLRHILQLSSLVNATGKKLFITHLGKGCLHSEILEGLTKHGIGFSILGEQNEYDITGFFAGIDLGLSTYPKVLFEKSGSIAAMLNNRLPVILLRKGFEDDTRVINELKEIEDIDDINEFIHQPKVFAETYNVSNTAAMYSHLLDM